MFIIELTYKVPNDRIDQHIIAHRAFLDKHYEAGHFIASGAKIPRDGGIILASASSKKEIEEIIKEDPFYVNTLADYRVIEFTATKKATNIQDLIH
jgi:uncharacterized protein YciI